MSLSKHGSPSKLKVVKNAGFSMDVNALAQQFLKQWPNKQVTMDQVHNGLKSIGIIDYQAEDFSELLSRLQAIGFTISK